MNPNEAPSSAMNMRPGEYKKEESNKLTCEKTTCGSLADLLFTVEVKEGDKIVEKRYCEKCWRQYWLERGYRR